MTIFDSIGWMIHTKVAKSVDLKSSHQDFPGGPLFKNPPANAGDTGLIPDLGRFYMSRSN